MQKYSAEQIEQYIETYIDTPYARRQGSVKKQILILIFWGKMERSCGRINTLSSLIPNASNVLYS